MADINGSIKKRALLASGVAQTVTFQTPVQSLDLAIMGEASVAFSTTAIPTSAADDTCNFLNADVPTLQYYSQAQFTSITFVANAGVTVQWIVR